MAFRDRSAWRPRAFLRSALIAWALLGAAPPGNANADPGPEIPPLGFEELFAALDPAFPDERVQEVRALAAAGNIQGAQEAYLAYRRALPWRHPLRDFAAEQADAPLMERSRTIAESLSERGVLIPFHVGWSEEPVQALPFDWEGLREADPETWAQAGRLYFLNDLGRAWRQTGDPRLADIWASAALGWIEAHRPNEPIWPPGTETPYPVIWGDYPYASDQWRPIEAGIRLQDGLTGSVAYFLDAPAMTPQVHARLVASAVEHARFLTLYDTAPYNWRAIESAGLMAAGALYPEFAEASAWRDEAVRRAREAAQNQILADGAQYELSPHYHCVVARDLWLIAELWRFAEPGAAPLFEVEGSLEAMIDFALRFQRPDGTEPLLGDSVGALPMREGFFADEWRDSGGLAYGLERFGREDWRFFAGEAGVPAPPRDSWFPQAGYAAVRSGWDAGALYVGMDLGPLGRSHWHEDGLHLSLENGGERWLADSGRGPYGDAFQREAYFLNSAGHNTARPLGRSQLRHAALPYADWADPAFALEPHVALQRPAWAYMRGVYGQGYGVWSDEIDTPPDGLGRFVADAEHRRQVFVERTPRRVWVFDELSSPGGAVSWEIFWRFDAASLSLAGLDPNGRQLFMASKAGPEGAKLSAWLARDAGTGASATVAAGQSWPVPQGWIQDAWTEPRPIPALTVTLQPSERTRCLSLFAPGEGALSDLQPLGTDGRAAGYAFAEKGASLRTVVAFNPGREDVSLGGLATDGECAAVWLSSDPRRPGALAWALAEGTYLEWEGAPLFASAEPMTAHGGAASSFVVR